MNKHHDIDRNAEEVHILLIKPTIADSGFLCLENKLISFTYQKHFIVASYVDNC